jgi:hypothetical protein
MKTLAFLACFATLAGCGGAGTMAPTGGTLAAVQSRVAQPMGATSVVTLLFDGVPLKNAPVSLRIKDKDGKMKNVLESRTGEKGRAVFNNVPQNVVFNLYYIVKAPGFEQRIGYLRWTPRYHHRSRPHLRVIRYASTRIVSGSSLSHSRGRGNPASTPLPDCCGPAAGPDLAQGERVEETTICLLKKDAVDGSDSNSSL